MKTLDETYPHGERHPLLGKNELAWLEAMVEHCGWWRERCGYRWSTLSATERLCRGLVKKKLVEEITTAGKPVWIVMPYAKSVIASNRRHRSHK